MENRLTKTLQKYIDNGAIDGIYSIDEQLVIIDNPSFAILPNHPYRCPLSVALYCTRGKGVGRINATTFTISRGSFMIVLPNQITELVDVSSDFQATYVIMTDEFTASLGIGNTFSLQSTIAQSPHIELVDRAKEALEGYLAMCKSIIPEQRNPNRLEIVILLTRAFFLGLGYFLHECDTPLRQSRKAEIADEFLRMVEANYREHRDIGYYAERMGLTPKHLSTAVKQASGHSGVEWIERYVVLDAKTQLCTTERTVKQIAYDLNFPSQSFFGKYFSRIVGLSPAAYRRRHKR